MFIKKLQDKNQSPHQQAQARKAIGIYYSGLASRQQPLLKPADHVKDAVEPYRAGENASPWDSALELLGECMSLRINNFNFDQRILTIHDGKGKKARLIFDVIAPLGRLQAGEMCNRLKIKANCLNRTSQLLFVDHGNTRVNN